MASTEGSMVPIAAPYAQHPTASELATKYASIIKGKTILITGVSPNSLGAGAASAIAAASPALLILAGHNPSTINETIAALTAVNPSLKTYALKLDLNSQSAIRAAAEEVKTITKESGIDVLICNAGVAAGPFRKTAEGLEQQFGVNHIGHFLFVNLLMDEVSKATTAESKARVVAIASEGHMVSGVRFDNLDFDDGKAYDKWAAYGQSKTANILFALELAERVKNRGVLAYSVHPGTIATNLGRDMTKEDLAFIGVDVSESGEITVTHPERFKSLEMGAATHIFAAFDPDIEESSGSYCLDARVANENAAPHARDKASAKQLWDVSEKLVNQKFEY